MARIRSIKPEFPQSETVGRLSRDARLLFIQIWTIVDDAGRARAASRMLASLLYPYDDDAPKLIEGWLAELEAEGCIRRYEVGGTRYLDLPNWLKHQKIDKPSGSKIPPFGDNSPNPREPSRILATDLGPRTMDLGSDQEEEKEEEGDRARAAARPPDWPEDFEEQFGRAYPRSAGSRVRIGQKLKGLRDEAIPFDRLLDAARSYAATTDARFVCNADRWLAESRWRNEPAFKGDRAPLTVPGVFVARDSPEASAWEEHEKRDGRIVKWIPCRDGLGRTMPSRWPPAARAGERTNHHLQAAE